MKKTYHEALYDYIKTGGQGLVINLKGSHKIRFRLPLLEDLVNSEDYDQELEIRKGSYILASTLQTIGGFEVPKNLKFEVFKQIMETPKFTSRVISYYWKCVKESHDYAEYFEAFCYTSKSRVLWEEWKQASRFGFKFFAQDFPLTELQKSWISYNEGEDLKKTLEDEWGRAFFIGSSMNPKGVQKSQRDWESKRKQEAEYRERLVEEANQGNVKEKNRDDLRSLKSEETLRKEYFDWIEGREDNHDIAVREYKERLMNHIEQRKNLVQRQTQEAREMAAQVQALNSLSMSQPIRAYTDEEVAKMTQGKKQTTIIFDEGSEYGEHLSKKYLKPTQVPGVKMPSLQEQVQNRPKPKIER
jgi:hypothetical protein